MLLYSIHMSGLDRLLNPRNDEIGGYTIGTDSLNDEIGGYTIKGNFEICGRTNLAQCKHLTISGGARKDIEKVADKPEMIGLEGIMIIIVDLHGGLDLPLQPINPDSFTTTNLASIAAAPPGLSNIVLPGVTRELHQIYMEKGLKKKIEERVQQNLQDNLQIIEDRAIEDIAAANQPPLTKKQQTALKKQQTALKKQQTALKKKMSLVSPDLFVLMLDDLRQSVKESFAESFSKWGRDSPHAQAALANQEERYRSLNIIKGFGVEPGVASLPYKKYVSYHDTNDKPTQMGVTTMTFSVNKKNKVTCSKMFTPADEFMPSIKYHEQQDPEGGTLYSATMEELINHFIEYAYNKKLVKARRKKTPETVVMMDLTCSVCRDGRVLSKPLDEYSGQKIPGGGNKKTKKKKKITKTKKKRRTYR
jgi:hypothetical protein